MTQPIRVLYEIHPHVLGGTERFLIRFLQRLNPRRYEPIVVSQKMGAPLQMVRSLGIRTETTADYFKPSGTARLAQFIKRNQIGLVQTNSYSSTLAIAANLADVPHVWRLGGHVDVGSGVRNRQEALWSLNIIRLLSSSIICNSHFVRSQFRASPSTPHIEVIHNGIATPIRALRENAGRNFCVGMVAHFTPQKRHMDFIRAAEIVSESLGDVSFKILGSSYTDLLSRSYEREVRFRGRSLLRQGKLSISEFVEFGNDVLSGCDMIVLPSVRESLSNAILEAMAAGLPVIATRSGGNPELVLHRKTGLLIPPMRPAALARAMLLLINDRKLMVQMGQAALKRARTHFSMDDCARSYEAVYSRVIFDFK
jgi:glycosyltransferase involved in cell wall biosynthesis